MTLHKAIEAAREALKRIVRYESRLLPVPPYVTEALSTLPAKPMSEDEVAAIINKTIFGEDTPEAWENSRNATRALRDAGVLYVEEK